MMAGSLSPQKTSPSIRQDVIGEGNASCTVKCQCSQFHVYNFFIKDSFTNSVGHLKTQGLCKESLINIVYGEYQSNAEKNTLETFAVHSENCIRYGPTAC